MAKQQILGQGTPEAPWYYEKAARVGEPMECPDPEHGERGRWFIRPTHTAKRCPWCTSERPTAAALKMTRRMAEHMAKKKLGATGPAEPVNVTMDAKELQAFRFFRKLLDKCREEAKRLRNEREVHDFGIYGRLKATEREIRLAELEAVSLQNEPVPVSFLSIATDLGVGEIETLRAGAGANPNYPLIQSYYQLRESRREILETIKQYKETIKALPADERLKPYGDILKLQDKLVDLLPKPKKREQLDFGDKDTTAAEELAMNAVALYCLTEMPQDARPGGPGPLR